VESAGTDLLDLHTLPVSNAVSNGLGVHRELNIVGSRLSDPLRGVQG